MKIYCINLDRRPDRMKYMSDQFDRLGLDYVRVPAVDGRTLDPGEISRMVRPGLRGMMSIGAFACFQSHREAWKRALESGEDLSVIVEDDILMADSVVSCLSDKIYPADADVIKLETFHKPALLGSPREISIKGRAVRRLYSRHTGAAGYIISAAVAADLLEITEDLVSDPVDDFIFDPRISKSRQLVIYQLVPAPITQGFRVIDGANRPSWVNSSLSGDRFSASDQVGVVGKKKRWFRSWLRSAVRPVISKLSDKEEIKVPFG